MASLTQHCLADKPVPARHYPGGFLASPFNNCWASTCLIVFHLVKITQTPLLPILFLATQFTLGSEILFAAEAVVDPAESTEAAVIKEAATEQARDREISADEDPSTKREVDIQKGVSRWLDEPSELDVYGSARIRYRDSKGESDWADGGSRAGVSLRYQVIPRQWLTFRYEAGFNLLSRVTYLLDPGESGGEGDESDIFTRLLYVGFETPLLVATFGKNWSSYYKVAGFTDRFEGTGGSASGTYNANTDGGLTGTGRADEVLQSRFYIDFFPERWGIKPFNLNVQLQNNEPIPQTDSNYGTTAGASAILTTKKDFTVGIALNWANVPDAELDELAAYGIDDDAVALLAGTRLFGERWYTGLTISRLVNHEATDENIYFDGSGVELYSQFQVQGPWWLIAGLNALTPDKNETQAGDYRVEYGVIGARYSIDGFRKMLYLNARIDNGRLTDGTALGNTYTIGVRWDLDKKFNWRHE